MQDAFKAWLRAGRDEALTIAKLINMDLPSGKDDVVEAGEDNGPAG
jgi:hypothetical protein